MCRWVSMTGLHMCQQAPGVSSSWLFGGEGQTLCSSYLSVLCRVGLLNIQGSVSSLRISYVCAQGSLGCLKLVFLSCLCVSQVAHHPVSLKPGIRETRITTFWRRTAFWGQDVTSVHPPKSSSIPMTHI